MTARRWRLELALLVLIIAAAGAPETYRYFDRRAIAEEVAQADTAATASTSPATVPEDARRWLEAAGYRVKFATQVEPRAFVWKQWSSDGGNHLIVEGQRRIRAGGWPTRATWLTVTFRFNPDGTFHDVQAEPHPMEFPEPPPSS